MKKTLITLALGFITQACGGIHGGTNTGNGNNEENAVPAINADMADHDHAVPEYDTVFYTSESLLNASTAQRVWVVGWRGASLVEMHDVQVNISQPHSAVVDASGSFVASVDAMLGDTIEVVVHYRGLEEANEKKIVLQLDDDLSAVAAAELMPIGAEQNEVHVQSGTQALFNATRGEVSVVIGEEASVSVAADDVVCLARLSDDLSQAGVAQCQSASGE